MEKVDLTKQFAVRLRDTMIAAGYNSYRSTSGVNIHKLAEMIGHSPQICRKYLRGQAIPEPIKLAEIASKLKVSPGWLLFGDSHADNYYTNDKIIISRNILHYIFTHISNLYNAEQKDDEIAEFLVELTNDIGQINTSEEQLKKIIDLALSSAKHFRPRL